MEFNVSGNIFFVLQENEEEFDFFRLGVPRQSLQQSVVIGHIFDLQLTILNFIDNIVHKNK